jgi:hypothetical protein
MTVWRSDTGGGDPRDGIDHALAAMAAPAPPAPGRQPRAAPGGAAGTHRIEQGAEDVMNAADGTWDCVIRSPLGDRHTALTVTTDGDRWTGTSRADGASIECENGTLAGDSISWTMQLTQPVPVVLECTATIEGDALTGVTKAGAFGSFAMSGTRAATSPQPDAR